ncbi:hypothetical protein, partial [Escherichia coli]|uniref:hypothetical protein n=1 Tax=Escherichia coli TaxID=562 RepID=UPI002916858A
MKNKGVYSEPDLYTGHPIDESTKNIVMEYFLNDDFNCSRQSPNKSDVVTVKINNTKTKKVKRFLTRSLKETYSQLRKENPNLQIGKSKFYSLRPSFVLTSPVKEACLCVHCENFELFLTSLIPFRGDKNSELDSIRSEITNTMLCSEPSDSCFLQECKDCPGGAGITLELLKLKQNCEDEITFALWDNG